MLNRYRYFVQGKFIRDPKCYGNYLYVNDIFEQIFFVSPAVYDSVSKAGNTKLMRALLC